MIFANWRTSPPSMLGVAALLLASGCSGGGDGLPREAVSGVVTLDGKPLARGMIQFRPADSGAAPGPSVGGGSVVEDGRFSIPRESGLVPGSYKVSINASSDDPSTPTKGRVVRKAGLAKELIPPKYNSNTELAVDVKEGNARDLKFDLQSN